MSIRRRLQVFAKEIFEGEINKQGHANDVNYDQRNGLGQVPDNQDVIYKDFAVMMQPSQFLRLVPPRDFNKPSSINYIKQHIANGKAIGSPWLDLINDKKGLRISSHEGRTRMKAIEQAKGDIPVLVHIFYSGRAKALTQQIIEQFRNSVRPEKSKI